MSTKVERQDAILRLVESNHLSTQAELAEALRGEGIEAVQATVSRDVARLGLVKVRNGDGRLIYALPGAADLRRLGQLASALRSYAASLTATGELLVIHTPRGLAAALAYGAQGIAMGTRFLMTRDCPVPEVTKQRYTRASTDDILVTTKIDGIPQRMIRNETLARLEKAGRLRMLLLALSSAWQMKRATGASVAELLSAARRMGHGAEASFAQSLMAAIAPAMFQRSMLAGEPQRGLLATGLVAGRLTDLPSCDELIRDIVREARARLAALGVTPLATA